MKEIPVTTPDGEVLLLKGGPNVLVYAKLIRAGGNLPGDLVLIELPDNCYVDPSVYGRL